MKQQVLANKSLWFEDLKCYLSLCQVSGTDSLSLCCLPETSECIGPEL